MVFFNKKRRDSELLTFLKQIPLLQTFSVAHLKKVMMFLKPVHKTFNAIIYKENDPATHLYIVK